MTEVQQRKERVSVNREIFDKVKQSKYIKKTKQELLEITNLKLQAERLKYFEIYTNSFLSLWFFRHYFYYLKQYML